MTQENKLVVLKKFNNFHEINIVKSFLTTKGIETIIFDEHINNLYATPAIFNGIRLMIRADLKEKALEELKKQERFLFEVPLVSGGETCPQCQSENTEIQPSKKYYIFWFFISLCLMVPLAKQIEEHWLCHKCQHQWSKKEGTGPLLAITYIIRLLILMAIGYIIYSYFIR